MSTTVFNHEVNNPIGTIWQPSNKNYFISNKYNVIRLLNDCNVTRLSMGYLFHAPTTFKEKEYFLGKCVLLYLINENGDFIW